LRKGIGVCLAAGIGLDDILDMTLPQIALASSEIAKHKADVFGVVMETVTTAMGGKVTKPIRAGREKAAEKKPVSAETKDAVFVAGIKSFGIPVSDA